MSWEEGSTQILAQMEELTRTAVVWMVVSFLLLAFMVVLLVLLLRMRSRERKMEAWLVREFQAAQDRDDSLERLLLMAQPPQGRPARPQRAPRPAREMVEKKETVRSSEMQTVDAAPAVAPGSVDLSAILNEMLTGNQPYNFIEAIRAMEPRLTLQRLTPRQQDDVFETETMLEPGGDGLFANIANDKAQLYPNYSRFSATLDPKPLFENARHGVRIHSILQPALLVREGPDTWRLVQRGRVQMRQGEES